MFEFFKKDKGLATTMVTVIILLAGVAAGTTTYNFARTNVKTTLNGVDKAYEFVTGEAPADREEIEEDVVEKEEEDDEKVWYEEEEYVPIQKVGKVRFAKDKVTLYLNHIYDDECVEVNLTDRGILTLVDFEYRKGYEIWYLIDIYEGTDAVAADYINRWNHSYRWVSAEDIEFF